MKTAIEILQEKVTEAAFYLDISEVNVIVEAMEEYAEQQLKILNIPVVMQRSELLLFAGYSESDKTSQTTDECVDNYLAQKSNSA